ncbi:MAG: HPP family protein, partial [Actinomycetota bacterium]
MQKPRLHSGVALLLALTGATIALIAIVPHMAHSQGLFLPSIGGSVLFVFALTDTPAAQPRALWVGHLGSAAIGILFLQAFGPGPTTMIVATVATIGFMVISRCVHPPAGANALAVIYSGAGWY